MYHFIVNPNSRSKYSHNLWASLEAVLKERGISYQVYLTDHTGHATEYAREIETAYRTTDMSAPLKIVIVGGDGTANEVTNGITLYHHIILGVVPSGSGNDLAHALGLPSNPFQALDRVLSPKQIRYVDHGILNVPDGNPTSHKFDVSAGIGYDAAVCHAASQSRLKKVLNRLHLGKLTYLIMAIKMFFTNKPLDAEIIIDGKHQHRQILFAAAMLGKYEGGGLKIAPQAALDDHLLSVCVVSKFAKWKFFYLLPSLLFGKHTCFKGVDVYDCASFELRCKEPAILHTDGEYAGEHTHVRLTCTPEQIRVLC